jgi:hypothetical protein
MSTRGSLLYKSWPDKFKVYNRYGFRMEFSLHVYHECIDNNIYMEINIFGRNILNCKLPLWALPKGYKESRFKY